jgi:hypothetical protein
VGWIWKESERPVKNPLGIIQTGEYLDLDQAASKIKTKEESF